MRRALIALALAAAAAPALAFVLPTPALLGLFEERRDTHRFVGAEIEGVLTVFDAQGERTTAPARRRMVPGGVCRVDLGEGAPEAWAGQGALYDRGTLRPPTEPALLALAQLEALACPLLSATKASELKKLLRALKVDTAFTGLSRQAGAPAYLIGARPWEGERPQLWLDKRTHLPVRLVGVAEGELAELRLIGYSEPATGEQHPGALELWVKGALRLRFTAQDLRGGGGLSAAELRK